MIYTKAKRKNSVAVVGLQLGDEGKGRVVDNKIEEFINRKDIKKVVVVRSQGGSNAGHTVEKGDIKLGLHQIPSGVFYEEVIEVLDSGMVIHIGDLLGEIELVEESLGSFSERLILSQDAMLCTDLQRAKEVLNRTLSGRAKGGTGRGIGPTTAEFYDKTGLKVGDLLKKNWKEIFSEKHKQFDKLFSAYDENLAETKVPDFKPTKLSGKAKDRTVGSLDEFLNRLENDRGRLVDIDIVKDTFFYHTEIIKDTSIAVIFEMAQAVGLDPWFGTRPDRTSTATTPFGINIGTRVWKYDQIEEIIGVIKATYMSSVGARTMPTEQDNEWSNWLRKEANEYGTTTGRPRDICYLDLPFLLYNIYISKIDSLVLTHLDISRRNEPIKICNSYTLNGKPTIYKPDMDFFEKVTPNYIEKPSWDVKEVYGKSDPSELPKESLDYVKFIEEKTGLKVQASSTGPERGDYVKFG